VRDGSSCPAGRRAIRHAKRPVLWGMALLILVHLALSYALGFISPELRDPDQAQKLHNLKECLASSAPDRPLVLMMGSSRVAMGYRPELVERDDGPIYYNYGLCFSGPIFNLITLHRILDAGIRPRAILLEVWPPHLTSESATDTEAVGLDINRLSWRDVHVLAPFWKHPSRLYQNWIVSRLEVWSAYRFPLTRMFAPGWLDTTNESVMRWSGMHERGWLGQEPYREHPPDEVYQFCLRHARFRLAKILHQPKLSRDSRVALTMFLDLCRHEGIQVGFIWMPESPEFRRSYRAEGLERATAELRDLAKNAATPLIDANDWVPEDGFADGYHLTHAGAELFTRILDREVLRPFIAHIDGRLKMEAGFLTRKAQSDKNVTSQRESQSAPISR
jgi:Protein of unknown function (DUF1574)